MGAGGCPVRAPRRGTPAADGGEQLGAPALSGAKGDPKPEAPQAIAGRQRGDHHHRLSEPAVRERERDGEGGGDEGLYPEADQPADAGETALPAARGPEV